MAPLYKDQLTLFVEDSPAKTLASQEKARGLQEKEVDCGFNSTGLSKKSNRRGSSLKTSAPFDLADWTTYSGALLRSGMTRNGTVYPLAPLAPLTVGTGFGSLPTPNARDYKDLSMKGAAYASQRKRHAPSLATESYLAGFNGPDCPNIYEWAMGFPAGHTELNNSETP